MNTSKTAPMPDLFSFLVYGFRNFWKPKEVWFFSLSPFLFTTLLFLVNLNQTQRLLKEVGSLISSILSFVCFLGIYYIAYNYAFGKNVSTKETIAGIRKFFWRGVGCVIINGMIFLPLGCFFIFSQFITNQLSIKTPILLIFINLCVSAFSAFLYFPLFELFNKDLNIGKSLKNGNRLFGSKLFMLESLGLVSGLFQQFWGVFSRIIIFFIDNNVNPVTFSAFRNVFYDPLINSNPVYMLLYQAGLIFSVPLLAFIFASAYSKYGMPQVSELFQEKLVSIE